MNSTPARLILAAVLVTACAPGSGPDPEEEVPAGPVLTFTGFDPPFVAAGVAGPEGDVTGGRGTLRFTVSPPAAWASPPTVTCTGTAGSSCACADAGGGTWACTHAFEVAASGPGRVPQSVTVEARAEPGGAATATLHWEADVDPPLLAFSPFPGWCMASNGLQVVGSTGEIAWSLDDAVGLASATCRLWDSTEGMVLASGSCSSGGFRFTSLANGEYHLQVDLVDLVGNEVSAMSVPWYVDASTPLVTFLRPGSLGIANPDIVAPDLLPNGTFSVDQDLSTTPIAFSCTLDGVFAPCSLSAGYDLRSLTEGGHTVSVIATDCAGNAYPPWALEFDVDLDGPALTLEALPAPLGTMRVTVVATDAITNVESVRCRIDGGTWTECPITGCPTPIRTRRLESTINVPVPSGRHVLDVQALDRWGHASRTVSLSTP